MEYFIFGKHGEENHLIKMPIYNPPNMTDGIDSILVGTASEVPAFIPSMLFFIFLTVWLGGIISQKRRMGNSDIPMWTVMASLSTLMIALVLTLIEGLMQIEILGLITAVVISSGIWLFLDRNRNEV